jgi:peptidoglycan/LPS O-acetylase OafA/YrhL
VESPAVRKPSPTRLSRAASTYLDVMRGVAALAVFVGHLRNLSFVDFGDVAVRTAATSALYFVTGFGHQAVVTFFVLSGYFVGGSVFRSFADGTWSWAGFLTARMSRLLVVLWPALVLGGIVDTVGTHVFRDHAIYLGSTTFGNAIGVVVSERLGVVTAAGNAAFVQTILCPTFGSNGALWSLANEFWYYVSFPLLCIALRRGSALPRVACACALAALGFFVGTTILFYYPTWLVGAVVAVLPMTKTSLRVARAGAVVTLLAIVGTLLAVRMGVALVYPDYVLAALITLEVVFLVRGPERRAPALVTKAAEVVARSSFTIYVVHLPLVALFVAATHPAGRWQPVGGRLLGALGMAAVVLAITQVMWWLFERRTAEARRALDAWRARRREGATT